MTAVVKQAVAITLTDGPPEQRLQMLRVLRDMGEDAREFVPALITSLADPDPGIRTAAGEALTAIDPDVALKAEER